MSKKKIIAIDVDNVLADSTPKLVEFSNRKWGTNLTIEDYDEDWAAMWKVDNAEAIRRAHTIYSSGMWSDFPHHEAAKPVLTKLSQHYKLIVTTSRVRYVQKDTFDWLGTHYKDIFEEVHLSGIFDSDHPDPVRLTKAELCKSIGVDFLVDDHPKHCFAAAELGVKGLLFGEYSWSRNLKNMPKSVTRVYDWQEVGDYFCGRS